MHSHQRFIHLSPKSELLLSVLPRDPFTLDAMVGGLGSSMIFHVVAFGHPHIPGLDQLRLLCRLPLQSYWRFISPRVNELCRKPRIGSSTFPVVDNVVSPHLVDGLPILCLGPILILLLGQVRPLLLPARLTVHTLRRVCSCIAWAAVQVPPPRCVLDCRVWALFLRVAGCAAECSSIGQMVDVQVLALVNT